jgi:ABC-type nitrate/sulfonate/bicarbonate transport system ATPase subunit
MARLRVEGLTKTLDRRVGAFPVLDHLSIEAGDGQLVCMLGPAGSGKSTALNILAGLESPDAGKVVVDHVRRRQATYGYVLQQPRLLNWKTVRQNVALPLAARAISAREGRDRIGHYLDLMGLDGFADDYPVMLSGGMRRRVAIARALVIQPDVLLMDEPFAGLDEVTAHDMMGELLRVWRRERRTFLFVTHNPLEGAYLADKVYVISARPGKVVREVRIKRPRSREIDDPALIPLQQTIIQPLLEQTPHGGS